MEFRRVLFRSPLLDRWFDDVDVLLTPAVIGEAPEGLASTGDPRFARVWTLLGPPAVSVPGPVGHTGLPIGGRLVARSGAEGLLVAWAEWLGRLLTCPRHPPLY